eukprot:3201269-Prymnesium_polylepis.1
MTTWKRLPQLLASARLHRAITAVQAARSALLAAFGTWRLRASDRGPELLRAITFMLMSAQAAAMRAWVAA